MPGLRATWAREQDKTKERIIAQFKDHPTKNHQLSSYQGIVHDGYDSGFTANTNNLEGTFVYRADTEFDTSASVNSNWELEAILPSELTINAAASKSILRGKSKCTVLRSSQMLSGAPVKMLANQQMCLVNKDRNTYGYVTLNVKMALMNYTRFDSLFPK